MTPRRIALSLLASGMLLASAFGCGNGLPDKVKYAAPPQAMLQSGCSVTFQFADATDDRMLVHFYITNMSNQPMMVNRDGFALRLPDGQILQRLGENQTPYILQPGEGHNVWTKYERKGLDLRTVMQASVIVGGISFANDPTPRVVGEVPLTQAGPKE
jgi:hypothetical protein